LSRPKRKKNEPCEVKEAEGSWEALTVKETVSLRGEREVGSFCDRPTFEKIERN